MNSLYLSLLTRYFDASMRFVRSDERSAERYNESSCLLSVLRALLSSSYFVVGGARSYVDSCQNVK